MFYTSTKRRSSSLATEASLSSIQNTHVPTDLSWNDLDNVKYFTSGGSSAIYTAFFNGNPVMVKTSKPNVEDSNICSQEIEKEMIILSKLNHPNIVKLYAAGKLHGRRFLVLERLDGGTMKQMISSRKKGKYQIKNRTIRSEHWMKNALSDAGSISRAMEYCHSGIHEHVIFHRDLKPDNIGYKADGTLKIIDFGLAIMIDRKSICSNQVYDMSGGTGSLRYMAPEVAKNLPYNNKVDIYSFGIIICELLSCKKAFSGLNIDAYFEHVVHGGLRPLINNTWPNELKELIQRCWTSDIATRPSFNEIVSALDSISADFSTKAVLQKKMVLKSNISRLA